MSFLPGVSKLEAMIETQNAATAQHRAWEAAQLQGIQTEAEKIKGFAEATNGQVQKHTIELAVIDEARKQALVVEAARVKAEETAKASHMSLKQGLQVATFSLLGGGVVTAAIYLALGLSTH